MAKKVLLIVLGAIGGLVGLGLLALGGVLLAVTGGGNYLGTGSHQVTTATYALASEAGAIDSTTGDPVVRIRIRATSESGRDLFLGVGPAADVDDYLAGVQHDVITDIELRPFRYDLRRVAGGGVPEPPAMQSFWTTSVTGPGEQTLEFAATGGSFQVVVMNADASQGVSVRGSLAVRIPILRSVAVGMLVVGGLVLLVGVALLVWGIRTRATPRGGADLPGGYGFPPAGYAPPVAGYGYPPPGAGPTPGYVPPPGYPQPQYPQPGFPPAPWPIQQPGSPAASPPAAPTPSGAPVAAPERPAEPPTTTPEPPAGGDDRPGPG